MANTELEMRGFITCFAKEYTKQYACLSFFIPLNIDKKNVRLTQPIKHLNCFAVAIRKNEWLLQTV